MIQVDRYQEDNLGKRIGPSRGWFAKAKAATISVPPQRGKRHFDRSIYADGREVKPALERLFNDKCAYCESLLICDWDVEHFRPKGRVAERPDHPGYYWLAYTWENLYPSCTHCNQLRRDNPRWDDPQPLSAQGKLDQFPLLDETTRAMSSDDDIYSEHTLLIDPCYDNPEWYLGYRPDGQIFALDDNPYGEKTIEVFHLRRRRLRDCRRKVMVGAIKCLEMIQKARERGVRNAEADFRELLAQFTSDDAHYAGIARFIEHHASAFLP